MTAVQVAERDPDKLYYAVLSCGCSIAAPYRALPKDEWPCEIHGPGWITRITARSR